MSILKVDAIQSRGSSDSAITFSGGFVTPRSVIMQVNANNTDQTISAATITKVQWENVEIDTINGWDATNHRYTPSVGGYYLVGGILRGSFSNVIERTRMYIGKNGASTNTTDALQLAYQFNSDIIINSSVPLPTGLLELNGSGDYLEVFFEAEEETQLHDSDFGKSYFFATLVHAT